MFKSFTTTKAIAFCLICYCLFSKTGHAQIKPAKIIPPSPEAAALGKYGDIPVSYYTGMANVSIPIYTIPLGELSVPINLNYSTNGIKVEEEASWAGLGWALQTGGVITRSVRDIDDFLNHPNY